VTSKFEIKGLGLVLARFDTLERELTNDTREALEETTLEVAYNAKRDAPVDLGGLQQSVNSEFSAGKMEGMVSVNAPYAAYVEFGTGGLVEIPQGWEEMAGQFKGQGKRKVNLPARPFLIPAAKKGMESLSLKLLKITQ
jgi:HK97 gp10 family phage protein